MSKLQIIKTICVLFILSVSVLACKNDAKLKYQIPTLSATEALVIHADSIKVEGDLGNFSLDKTTTSETDGVQLITFTFSANESSELQPVSIQFSFPSIDINAFWNPKISIDKVNYYSSGITSKASVPMRSWLNVR